MSNVNEFHKNAIILAFYVKYTQNNGQLTK